MKLIKKYLPDLVIVTLFVGRSWPGGQIIYLWIVVEMNPMTGVHATLNCEINSVRHASTRESVSLMEYLPGDGGITTLAQFRMVSVIIGELDISEQFQIKLH